MYHILIYYYSLIFNITIIIYRCINFVVHYIICIISCMFLYSIADNAVISLIQTCSVKDIVDGIQITHLLTTFMGHTCTDMLSRHAMMNIMKM